VGNKEKLLSLTDTTAIKEKGAKKKGREKEYRRPFGRNKTEGGKRQN